MMIGTARVALTAILAAGLIAAGCGGDEGGDTPTVDPSEITNPQRAEEALEGADQALEDAPEQIDQAIEQCQQGIEDSDVGGEQRDQLLELCQLGANGAQDSLDNAEGLRDQLEQLGE
ncbi:MAG: hypothetical protein ACR2K6_10135 [Solirubrobacterales bacterium]